MAGEEWLRIGHKGADAIEAGNTLESFDAAVELGVDMIELDVLRLREGKLVVAHDPEDAMQRRPLDLLEALDAFLEPPLDQVSINFDLKKAGREAEFAGAIAGHGLIERSSVSSMEMESLVKLRSLEPDLRLGWTYPKSTKDWTTLPWAGAAVSAGLAALRRGSHRIVPDRAVEMDVDSVWVYDPVITPRLVDSLGEFGIEVIAWTVDDPDRMQELIEMGVAGICSNDPRLFPPRKDGGGGSKSKSNQGKSSGNSSGKNSGKSPVKSSGKASGKNSGKSGSAKKS